MITNKKKLKVYLWKLTIKHIWPIYVYVLIIAANFDQKNVYSIFEIKCS